MSIVLQGSTSGSITLQEPAVAGSTVLDLPATSGTILTTGSSGQSIPKAALPTGSVLQVVSASNSTYSTTTSLSFVDTALSASITPTSSSSKILVLCSLNGAGKSNANANGGGNYRIIRGASTEVIYLMNGSGWTGLGEFNFPSISCSYLDSPATTSSTTYKVQFSSQTTSANASFNWYDSVQSTTSTLTLVEIAA